MWFLEIIKAKKELLIMQRRISGTCNGAWLEVHSMTNVLHKENHNKRDQLIITSLHVRYGVPSNVYLSLFFSNLRNQRNRNNEQTYSKSDWEFIISKHQETKGTIHFCERNYFSKWDVQGDRLQRVLHSVKLRRANIQMDILVSKAV